VSPLTHALTLAVSLAPSSADYERLARRVAFCWGVAINGDVLSAARNACTPLALDACATEADARRAFTSTLTHLRDVREQGFARLLDTQIAFLAGVAVQLWLSHREDVGRRETLVPPPAPCECCGLTNCDGECHDDDAPSATELREYDEREYRRTVRESLS
jgi:hypothetical protein